MIDRSMPWWWATLTGLGFAGATTWLLTRGESLLREGVSFWIPGQVRTATFLLILAASRLAHDSLVECRPSSLVFQPFGWLFRLGRRCLGQDHITGIRIGSFGPGSE